MEFLIIQSRWRTYSSFGVEMIQYFLSQVLSCKVLIKKKKQTNGHVLPMEITPLVDTIQFHKITKAVHALWFAERCVCMRVCKQLGRELIVKARIWHRFWVDRGMAWDFEGVRLVVKFFPLFKFRFPLFWGMAIYENEFETKENKIWTKDKIAPQHTHLGVWRIRGSYV